MKKIFLFILLLFGIQSNSLLAQSEFSPQTFADLLSVSDEERDFFRIEDYWQQYEDSIRHADPLPLLYKAHMAKCFNNLSGSIEALLSLIEHPDLIDNKGLANMMRMFLCEAYFDAQEYQKALQISDDIYAVTTTDTVFNENEREFFLGFCEYAKNANSWASRCFPEKMEVIDTAPADNSSVNLIREKENNGIFFNAKWNNRVLRTAFDTGAATCFFASRAKAEAAGVKIFTTDTVTVNEQQKGLLGRIDSLELGKFKVKNIPVFVSIEEIDRNDPDQVKCDSMLNSQFDIVIGLPIIKELGVIEFDFTKNTLTFLANDTQPFNDRKNMCLYYKNNMDIALLLNFDVEEENFTAVFDTGGFFGLSVNSVFYNVHKNKIPTLSVSDDKTKSFIGGCSENSV